MRKGYTPEWLEDVRTDWVKDKQRWIDEFLTSLIYLMKVGSLEEKYQFILIASDWKGVKTSYHHRNGELPNGIENKIFLVFFKQYTVCSRISNLLYIIGYYFLEIHLKNLSLYNERLYDNKVKTYLATIWQVLDIDKVW